MKKVFLNGKLVDIDKAGIPVTDSGFLYGAGLFETMRSYKGVVFCLEDHLERVGSLQVTFLPSDAKTAIWRGESVLDAARKAGVSIRADCDGVGACGTCKVAIREGDIERVAMPCVAALLIVAAALVLPRPFWRSDHGART